jgi:hypothetical protein
MREKNQEQEKRFRGSENNALDLALDAALAKYAAVEPRIGIEDRILVNLRTQPVRVANHKWWSWSMAVALVVVVAAVLALRSGTPSHPVIANHPAVTTQTPTERGTQLASRDDSAASPREHAQIRRAVAHPSRPKTVVAADPKLDQFPSPQPLSDEELALARYVRDFPQEAVLIAKAQEEYEIEIQKKMRATNKETEPLNSDRQER